MILLACLAFLVQERTVDQWIEALGSESIEDREKATHELLRIGKDHISELQAAATHKDAEIAYRVNRILEVVYPQRQLAETVRGLLNRRTIALGVTGKGRMWTPGQIEAVRSEGSLFLRGENEVALEGRLYSPRGGWREFVLVSDGSRMRSAFLLDSVLKWSETREAPRSLRQDIVSLLPLSGFSSTLLTLGFEGLPDSPFAERFLRTSSGPRTRNPTRITLGQDGDLKIFTFETVDPNSPGERGGFPSETLWVQPISNLPMKRITSWVRSESEAWEEGGSLTESYDTTAIEREIPVEKFRLPELKR